METFRDAVESLESSHKELLDHWLNHSDVADLRPARIHALSQGKSSRPVEDWNSRPTLGTSCELESCMTTFVPSLSLELLRADIPDGVRIRNTRWDDLPQIPDLMRRVYPPPLHGPEAVWSEGSLRRHLEIYPSGQLVAEDKKGRIIGTSTSMRVGLDAALAPHTWSGITGQGTLETHQPDGEVLYGVNIAVDPACQGRGIGHGLYRKRLELGHRQGCLAFIAGARLAGYLRHSYLPPEDYLEAVREGRIFDPTISKQMSLGFMVVGLLRNYAPDPETQGHAALIILLL